jgi:single-strand DNA-binding protein
MINKAILLGRMTKDIEIRHTNSGTMVGTFTLAVENGYGENKTTDFINCVAWEKTAEFIQKWFGKGRMIAFVGRIATRSWDGEDGRKKYATEVVVKEVSFVGDKREDATSESSGYDEFNPLDVLDDDCPF